MKLFTLLIALKCVLSLPTLFLSNQDKLNVGFQGLDIFSYGWDYLKKTQQQQSWMIKGAGSLVWGIFKAIYILAQY